jgi:tol-pal system protein YbgF
MLQRQVYRGAPAPIGGDPGAAVSAELRINRLEEEIRDLTGRVEEFSNQVDQLRHRVEQINGDVDTRLSQAPPASGGLAAAGPPPRPGPAPGSIGPGPRSRSPEPLEPDSPALAPRAGLMPPGTPIPPPPGGGAPTPIFGTLTPPGAPPTSPEQAAANAARSGAATPPPSPARPAGTPAEQYNQAFSLLKQADYPAAETALKAFVEQHPKDPMAGSAQYWLGETFYTRGKYMEAAATFAEGYNRYPKPPKAAEELLKLGMALARANQTKNACVALGQLDHDFPNPGATIRQRADTEKKRLGC